MYSHEVSQRPNLRDFGSPQDPLRQSYQIRNCNWPNFLTRIGTCRTRSHVLRPQRPRSHLTTFGNFGYRPAVEERQGRREANKRSAAGVIFCAGSDSCHRKPCGTLDSPSVPSLSRFVSAHLNKYAVGYSVFAFNQTIHKKLDPKTHQNLAQTLVSQLKRRPGVAFLKRITIVLDEDSEKGFGLVSG